MIGNLTQRGQRALFAALLAVQTMVWSAVTLLAQEGGGQTDVNVDISADNGAAWYGMWWVWVIIAVFIIVIVALTTRGGRSEQ